MTREQRIQRARDAVVRAAETMYDAYVFPVIPLDGPEKSVWHAVRELRAAERTPKPPRKARAR